MPRRALAALVLTAAAACGGLVAEPAESSAPLDRECDGQVCWRACVIDQTLDEGACDGQGHCLQGDVAVCRKACAVDENCLQGRLCVTCLDGSTVCSRATCNDGVCDEHSPVCQSGTSPGGPVGRVTHAR